MPILLLFSDVNASPMLLEIVNRLKQSNHNFHVVLIGDADLEIAKAMGVNDISFSLITKRSKYGVGPMTFAVLRELFSFRPKTILASGQYATLLGIGAAYLLRVPRRIFIRHHSNFHTRYHMRQGIFIDRVANSLSTQIVAVSVVVRNILISAEGVDPKKVKLIHNGINLQKFSPTDFSRLPRNQDPQRKVLVGAVSRFTEWKGLQYSVKAFVEFHLKHPNSHLHLVGAPADAYDTILDQLKVVEESAYTISNWHSNVFGFLQTLDVFIHVPIGPDDEAFGLVYLEALASRTPCIFTLSGVLHELPNPEKYAEIVPYENSEDILASMLRILDATSPVKENVSESWLVQYSLETMGKEYMKLLVGELTS